MQHLKFYRRKSEDKLYILKVAKLGEFDKNLNIQNLPIRNFEINLLNSLKNKYNVQWTLWRISEFYRVSSKKKNTDTYFNIRFSKSRKGLQNRDSQICIVFFSYLRKLFSWSTTCHRNLRYRFWKFVQCNVFNEWTHIDWQLYQYYRNLQSSRKHLGLVPNWIR